MESRRTLTTGLLARTPLMLTSLVFRDSGAVVFSHPSRYILRYIHDGIIAHDEGQRLDTMIRRILLPAVISGLVLMGLSYLILYATIYTLPGLVEEYYDPIFWPGSDRATLFFAHPFVVSLALAWLWDRFKVEVAGPWLLRGLKFGLAYAVVATLPSMWVTFSAIAVSLSMVLTWFAYGLMQAIVCGFILAKMNP